MSINMNSIMSKVSSYAESSAGKEKMSKCIQRYVESDIRETAAGDKLVSEEVMWEAVSRFIYVMKVTAANYDLPQSVLEHINSLESSDRITKTSTGYEVPLYFGGDLYRDSLENDLGYEGVDNIVALFNNGYHAKNYVYGWWNNHQAVGDGVLRSGVNADFAWVKSKKEREALRFIQRAVEDFNANYGREYGVTAVAGPAYK